MSGTSKNFVRRVSDVAAWLRTSCDDDFSTTYRQASECRLTPAGNSSRCYRHIRQFEKDTPYNVAIIDAF